MVQQLSTSVIMNSYDQPHLRGGNGESAKEDFECRLTVKEDFKISTVMVISV